MRLVRSPLRLGGSMASTSPNLWLDRVTHVSLVDEPAVGDSEFVVMKHEEAADLEDIQEALDTVSKEDDENMTDSDLEQLLAGEIEEWGIEGEADEMASQLAGLVEEAREARASDPGGEESDEHPPLRTRADVDLYQMSAKRGDSGDGTSDGSDSGHGPLVKDLRGAIEGPSPELSHDHVRKNQPPRWGPKRRDVKKAIEGGNEEEQNAASLLKKQLEASEGELPEHVEKQFNALEQSLKNEGEGKRQGTAPDTSMDDSGYVKKNGGHGSAVKDLYGVMKNSENTQSGWAPRSAKLPGSSSSS